MVKILNFVLYNLAWFACVLSLGAPERWWWGPAAVAPVVIWHLLASDHWRRDAVAIALASALGPVIDTVLLNAGLIHLPASVQQPLGWLPPGPMWLLWPAFATLFYCSLRWITDRYLLLAACSLVGGPMAYFTASNLMARFGFGPGLWPALALIGVIWALGLPAMLYLINRVNRGIWPAAV